MTLDFLYYPIAWVLKMWHALVSQVLAPASGAAWVLSIMLLVVTVRILLFPLFVKMIRSQRSMQELQPEIAKLKKEYGSDRRAMSEEMMKLQRERGVNPLAGCLPLVLQAPVFIALLHVLRRLAPDAQGLYSWSDELTTQAASAMVFGAPISSNFLMTGEPLAKLIDATGTTSTQIKVVTGVLIVVMCVTQFITTKQIMKRSTSQPIDNPQMQMVQKLMLYGAPLGLFVTGGFFPLGVLLYWFFNNLWTIGQQFWVLRKMPPPGQKPPDKKKDAERAEIDRTRLAPKPGAKPVRPTKSSPGSTVVPGGEADESDAGSSSPKPEAVVGDSDKKRPEKPAATKAGALGEGPRTPLGEGPRTPRTTKPGSKSAASSAVPRPGAKPQRRKKR